MHQPKQPSPWLHTANSLNLEWLLKERGQAYGFILHDHKTSVIQAYSDPQKIFLSLVFQMFDQYGTLPGQLIELHMTFQLQKREKYSL